MNPISILRVAGRALLRNKLRSFLTTLGIIIGVAAVIAMVAIGEGAKKRVEETFNSMGTNLLILLPGSANSGGMHGGFGTNQTLTWDDLKAIHDEVPTVKYVAPQLRTGSQLMSEDQNWGTQVIGTTPEYFEIRTWNAALGQRFTQSDVDSGAKVIVLGQTVVDKLFGPNANPVGQMIRVKNIPFQVIGVLEKKGQSPFGQDYDDTTFVPVSTYSAKIQGNSLGKFVTGMIYIGATSADATSKAEKDIANLLRDRHHIQQGQEDDFNIRNLTEMANAQQDSMKTLSMLLMSVAAVSLLVGGIGIMNIMLVSVTERTREIGVRMAVGAKPKSIMAQFLVEALTLSVMGGFIGVAIGLITTAVLARTAGWSMVIRPDIIAISVTFSALVGLIFGLYPARKASLLDPIEALRYE